MTSTTRRAVFLDRDGTLNEEVGYLDRLERMVLFPYTADAVRRLNDGGFAVVVVTNQAGIARGLVAETFVDEAHRHISDHLDAHGARVDAYYHCPHHPDGVVASLRKRCECRKPQPGLLRRAAADLGLDLSASFIVGDRWHDVQAGQTVGAQGVLVRTGYGRQEEQSPPAGVMPAVVVDNVLEAALWILRQQ